MNQQGTPPCGTCGHPQSRHVRISKKLPDQWCRMCPGDPSDLTGPARHPWNTTEGVTDDDRRRVEKAQERMG